MKRNRENLSDIEKGLLQLKEANVDINLILLSFADSCIYNIDFWARIVCFTRERLNSSVRSIYRLDINFVIAHFGVDFCLQASPQICENHHSNKPYLCR